ncbi:MAG: Mur ligase family protein [Phycisphaerales bacterium]
MPTRPDMPNPDTSGAAAGPAAAATTAIRARLSGRRVAVMGLGRFGGGTGAVRWLAGAGARVTVSDQAPADSLEPSVDGIRDLVDAGSVTLELGGHVAETFAGADLVVVGPAVPRPWANPILAAAVDAGVPLTTEIELLVRQLPRERTAAVTGTTGKSTTVTLAGRALESIGRTVHLGGNLGGSLLPRAATLEPHARVILELSSFQLFWLGAERPGASIAGWFGDERAQPGWSPRVAAWTNLSPNHLDWHGSMDHYRQSKDVIRAFQATGDVFLRSADVPAWPATAALGLPGAHNRTNAALAVAIAAALADADPVALRTGLADAESLPHRLQTVHEHRGLSFVDDSKCTTPGGVALAAAAMRDRHPDAELHIIVGGADKGLDLAGIAALARGPRAATLHAIGATGQAIAEAADDPAANRGTVRAAVEAAVAAARPPAVILLSPGCASWDQYPNYIARGADFADAARSIAAD